MDMDEYGERSGEKDRREGVVRAAHLYRQA